MILAAVIALFLQAPDTLAPAAVFAVKELPVVKATESVRLDAQVYTPPQVADVLKRHIIHFPLSAVTNVSAHYAP